MQASTQPTQPPYQRIGGDAAIRKLVDRFYALMDELPETYAARKLHPADLAESGNKFSTSCPAGSAARSVMWKKTAIRCCDGATCPTRSAPRNATNGCCA